MFKDKKIQYINIIPVVLIIIVLFRLVNNIENFAGWIMSSIVYLSGIASYLICGFCIAFLLNPMMKFFIRKFKFNKLLSLILVYLLLLGLISLFFVALIPMIISNITDLYTRLPVYFENMNKVYWNIINEIDEDWLALIQQQALNFMPLFEESINQLMATILNAFSLSSILSALTSTTSALLTIIFGFVLSVYMLWDKDNLIVIIKRIISGLFKEKMEKRILKFGSLANKIFSAFFVGKALDSAIILVLCLICTTILGIKYALIISLVVGITNMIPYFGPIIGGIPCVFLSLFVSPIQALETGIIIIVIQQLDGLIIGPKILGNQVGLSPILIIAGITIGGNLGGFIGMLVGVPVIALLKTLIYDQWLEQRLQKKGVPVADSICGESDGEPSVSNRSVDDAGYADDADDASYADNAANGGNVGNASGADNAVNGGNADDASDASDTGDVCSVSNTGDACDVSDADK